MSKDKRKLTDKSEIYAGHTMGPAVGPWGALVYPAKRVIWCRVCKEDTEHVVQAEGSDWTCVNSHNHPKPKAKKR